MKPYIVRIQPAQGPAWHYHGLFAHGCDAVVHALDLLQGQPARISARVLPC